MLDCRGLACPQPVMRTKEEVDAGASELEVLVDNKAASQNVSRFLDSQGFACTVSGQGDDFLVSGKKDPGKVVSEEPLAESFSCGTDTRRQLVLVRSDTIGRGDPKLGAGLMKNFILTLKEMGPELWRMIFLNSGVKLCTEGSESIDALKELTDSGVSILVCGTCLEFFGLTDQKEVGDTTNMLDVVTSLQAADKVITV